MNTRTRRQAVNILIIIAMLTIMSGLALALGVGPSRQTLNFEPGQTISNELVLINDGQADLRIGVYAQGDLAEHVIIKKPLIDVSASEATKKVMFEIAFPEEPPKPGNHLLEIVLRQFPPENEQQKGTVIAATMALIAQIVVKVPFPGKYAEGKLFISGSEDMETPTKFGLIIYNFGEEEIREAHAKIEVFGPTWEKLAEFQTNNASIKSKEEATLQALWKPDVNKGTYRAVVTVYYDDKYFKLEQNFDVGTFAIDVNDISVEKFRLGDVAKFDIILYNSWNREINDLYVEMVVEDSAGKRMTEFKTAAIDIAPKEEGKLEAYWYTEGVMPGIYTVKLIIHYAEKITQKQYEFEVSTNRITKLGIAGGAVLSDDETESIKSSGVIILLIIIVLVLIIGMNIVWFYTLSRILKKKGGEK